MASQLSQHNYYTETVFNNFYLRKYILEFVPPLDTRKLSFKIKVLTAWMTKSFGFKNGFPMHLTLSEDSIMNDEVHGYETYYDEFGEINDVCYGYFFYGWEFIQKVRFVGHKFQIVFKKFLNTSKWKDNIPLENLKNIVKFCILYTGRCPKYNYKVDKKNKSCYIPYYDSNGLDELIGDVISLTNKLSNMDINIIDKTKEEYQISKKDMLHTIRYGEFDQEDCCLQNSNLIIWKKKIKNLFKNPKQLKEVLSCLR